MTTDDRKKIGDYLQNIRKKSNISLEEISRETKININLLKLLEENKLEDLPGKTYVKGFVVNYLKYLKTDSEEALNILTEDYREFNNNNSGIYTPPEVIYEVKTSQSISIDTFFNKKTLAIVIICLLGFGLYKVINKLAKKPDQSKTEINSAIKLSTTTTLLSTIESTTTTSTSSSSTTSTTLNTRYPYVEFKKISRPYYDIETEEVLDEIPKEYQKLPSMETNTLYIRASFGKCWIRYKVDDKEIKSFTLKKDQELFLTGDNFFFNFGSVGSLEIFYNNRRVNAPSNTGFKLLILPIEKARSHFYPLFVDDRDNVTHFYTDYQKLMSQKEEKDSSE